MSEPIVFVVGAGASVPYGLPTGSKLRHDIHSGNTPRDLLEGFSSKERAANLSEYRRFQSEFKHSRRASIDRFLQNRPEFAVIGKQAICRNIYQAETKVDKFPSECWISWVFDKLVTRYGASIRHWPIKVVTFNYDRVFEYLLAEMHANTSEECSFADSYKQISEELDLVHVYGRIPEHPNNAQAKGRSLNFGLGDMPVSDLADKIQVLGEERGGSWTGGLHTEAYRIMRSASTVIFLGFSFDPVNCSAIGLGENHDLSVNGAGWYSSGHGVKTRERADACKLTSDHMKFGGIDTSCLEFLREFVSI